MELYSIGAAEPVAKGQRAYWQANAPAGLMIVGASIPGPSFASIGVNDGNQYGGGFYWAGSGAQVHDGESGPSFGPLWSSYFGFQLICGHSPCNTSFSQITVGEADLNVQETVGPSLVSPDGLWQSQGWIRGDWNLHFWGDSPSGLCALGATIKGQSVANASSGQNPAVWHQCSAPAILQTIHTSGYGQGPVPLTLGAWDAAGLPVNYTKTIYIDNAQPTISLSGPNEAPSTAGTQYVTASAAAGPSGVAGISCSADGAPARWYPGATAQVPVDGVGQHQVQCFSESNAHDGNGTPGVSAMRSFSMSIRVPTVAGIAFKSIADRLRCKRVKKRVKVPGRTVIVRRHHKLVRIHKRPYTKVVKVTKCHPRTILVHRIVVVTVRRHGKKVKVRRRKTIRVPVPPHAVLKLHRRVAFGHTTTVSGWLGTYDGVALGGQAVEILSAPDNASGAFTPVAWATTASNGGWSAQVPAGPSRLIEADYGGAATLEPSLSGQVTETVPAKVKLLRVVPRRVAWGQTVRITGQLLGGYLPSGGALVRLRIGQGSSYQTYGVQEHVTGSGRFTTTYQFGAGDPAAHRSFWFQIATLPMGDYPYLPAASGRRSVLVGGHPRPPATHRHHKHKRKRHRKR